MWAIKGCILYCVSSRSGSIPAPSMHKVAKGMILGGWYHGGEGGNEERIHSSGSVQSCTK